MAFRRGAIDPGNKQLRLLVNWKAAKFPDDVDACRGLILIIFDN